MARFDHRAFLRLVDMTPAEIRRWHDDPRSACASSPATRARLVKSHRYLGPGRQAAKATLPSLDKLVAKVRRGATLSEPERLYAESVANFVKRHKAQGCSPRRAAALANWGSRACKVPAKVPGCTGLGRPVPVDCPAEQRIEIKSYTRCKPPKRGASPGEPLLEYARASDAPERKPMKARKKSKRELDKDADREKNLEDSKSSLKYLVDNLDYIPTERDIRPRDFPADPCTGEQYEDWKGRYSKTHASYLKPLAWSEKIAGCARDLWCREKGPCPTTEDTSFDPSEFMDGLGRRRRKATKKRKAPKKTARKRSR